MFYKYKTKDGVCSRNISFTMEDGIIMGVEFEGGCNGNTQGISKLVYGMKAEDVIKILKNIKCGFKESSCPDQLAKAIEQALKKQPSSKD